MSKLFSYDNPVISALGVIADIVFVNFLFLLTCIPIFTIGAAQAALYTVGGRWAERKEAGVAKFWSAFRENFRGSIAPWLILLLVGFSLVSGVYVTLLNPTVMQVPCLIMLGVLAILFLMIDAQAILFYSRFECSLRQLFANAFLTAMAHPLRTIARIVLKFLPLILFYCAPNYFFFLTPLWLIGYASLCSYLSCLIMRKPFRRYAEQIEGNPNGNSR